MVSDKRISQIIKEEITKAEVENIAKSRISSELSSSDFNKKIRSIIADTVEDLFKNLWQRSSTWKGGIK